ncbi:MAG: hypothetical protein H6592_01310 [Flavobacteriales bacterium]|nr:hypothetical protein [Flavobacteriales bacterium]
MPTGWILAVTEDDGASGAAGRFVGYSTIADTLRPTNGGIDLRASSGSLGLPSSWSPGSTPRGSGAGGASRAVIDARIQRMAANNLGDALRNER